MSLKEKVASPWLPFRGSELLPIRGSERLQSQRDSKSKPCSRHKPGRNDEPSHLSGRSSKAQTANLKLRSNMLQSRRCRGKLCQRKATSIGRAGAGELTQRSRQRSWRPFKAKSNSRQMGQTSLEQM